MAGKDGTAVMPGGFAPERWRAALNRALESAEDGPEGLTMREIAQMLGVTLHLAQLQVREAVSAGLLEFAGMRQGRSIIGRSKSTPVYALRSAT